MKRLLAWLLSLLLLLSMLTVAIPTVIITVKGVQQSTVFCDKGNFGGRGTGIDS